jgi:hypothetical protein
MTQFPGSEPCSKPFASRTYGLYPAWQGPRWLASLNSVEETVQGMSLGHGSRRAGIGSIVRVESYPIGARDAATEPADALFRLMVMVNRTSHPRAPEDVQRGSHERAQRRVAKASTDELNISVGGEPVPFSIIIDDPLWAAVPTKAGLGLTVLGIREEPSRMRLVTVDPEDYLDGTVALARADGRL